MCSDWRSDFFQRRDKVVRHEFQLRVVHRRRVVQWTQLIRSYTTVRDIGFMIDFKNLRLSQILKQIPQAQHDHLMCHNEHA